MYKVEFTEQFKRILENFIDSYKNTFLNRFSDTWIFSEEVIREYYIKNSIEFYEEIIDKIENIFWKSEILWYKPLENNKRESGIIIGNYNLFIEYFEDLENKIRVIEKIEFHRK